MQGELVLAQGADQHALRLSDIIGEILYGRPLQLMCHKMQQNGYSVAFGWPVAWKIKTLHVAIGARVAL